MAALCLIERCDYADSSVFEKQIDNFQQVYSLPKEYIFGFVQSKSLRLRLLPPYREYLSQAFARFFMRVGLPMDFK